MPDLTAHATPEKPAPRKPKYFEVPAGTPPSKCRACDAVVYVIRTGTGNLLAIDCDVESGAVPSPHEDAGPRGAGVGVSHLFTCARPEVERG